MSFARILVALVVVLFVVAEASVATANAKFLDRNPTSLGYGLQRLKKFRSKTLFNTAVSCDGIEELWYKEAIIDNFAPIEHQKKWEGKGQRYWINRQFWAGDGSPIFVFIGGEGQESCTRLTNRMYVYQLAQQHNAMMIDVEHRFYGQSYPTTDMSTDNLQYLSSTQALADLARIIGYVKTSNGIKNSKVITVGGSYPGNLAAWFRLKYPSVTHGSIASSAPLTAKTNFYEYMEVVGDAMKYFSGQSCYDAFERAANVIAKLIAQGESGIKTLEKDFATCSPIKDNLDLGILLSDLMGNVQGTVQYNNEHNGVMNVTDICNVMLKGKDSYQQFVDLSAMYRQAGGMDCEDASWKDVIDYLADPTMDPTNSARPWVYQTCNEFGYYQTADSKVFILF